MIKTALIISSTISIPYAEFDFSYATSSGAGGQNVNKVSSKAIMRWWPSKSPSISEETKARFLAKFRSRLTNDGELVLMSQRYRSQPQNAGDCLDKLREMVQVALVRPKARRATKPTRGSKMRRLTEKRRTAETKSARRRPARDD